MSEKNIIFKCSDIDVLEHFPPVPATKFRPDWYNELPFYMDNHKETAFEVLEAGRDRRMCTIKACVPVKDYITQGYIIRNPADILITPDSFGDEQGWWAVGRKGSVDAHPHKQCPIHINKKRNAYFKISHSWIVQTPSGYSSYFYQPAFFMEERFKLFPAVVDTDTFPSVVNFPGVILTDETFMLKAGEPLMVVFPFKRENWKHKVELETQSRNPVLLTLERGYKRLFHRKKFFS